MYKMVMNDTKRTHFTVQVSDSSLFGKFVDLKLMFVDTDNDELNKKKSIIHRIQLMRRIMF